MAPASPHVRAKGNRSDLGEAHLDNGERFHRPSARRLHLSRLLLTPTRRRAGGRERADFRSCQWLTAPAIIAQTTTRPIRVRVNWRGADRAGGPAASSACKMRCDHTPRLLDVPRGSFVIRGVAVVQPPSSCPVSPPSPTTAALRRVRYSFRPR